MRVYNGENLKELDPNAKSILEYKEDAGITEGMKGISTRFAFKILIKSI
jgi:serine protein kinase